VCKSIAFAEITHIVKDNAFLGRSIKYEKMKTCNFVINFLKFANILTLTHYKMYSINLA